MKDDDVEFYYCDGCEWMGDDPIFSERKDFSICPICGEIVREFFYEEYIDEEDNYV
jgi:hypothetical protein